MTRVARGETVALRCRSLTGGGHPNSRTETLREKMVGSLVKHRGRGGSGIEFKGKNAGQKGVLLHKRGGT